MYNQTFTYEELAKCLTQNELMNAHLSREQYAEKIKDYLQESLLNGTYQFNINRHNDIYVNGNKKNTIEHTCQNLILRKIAKNIKKIYSIKFANRNKLIRQIISLLKEKADFYVLRTDISSFYESVDRDAIISSLNEKGRVTTLTSELIEKLFDHPSLTYATGLPRGLSISAVLSELYMRKFDLIMRKQEGTYFYARYVDDIIIFCVNKNICETIKQKMEEELLRLNLTINTDKTIIWNSNAKQPLEYLGYTFNKDNGLKTTIAIKKFNRIKTRITRSFLQYGKDHNFENLVLRIKYLSGNFKLKNRNNLFPVPVGWRYSYKYISDYDSKAEELDNFCMKLLFTKNTKFGTFTPEQINRLKQIRFLPKNKKIKIWYRFSEQDLQMIKSCWQ